MSNLSNVKLSKKEILEEIQARLVLLHQKLTQQELLDKCVEYAKYHFDDFVNEQIITPKLTKEKVRRIKQAIYKGEINLPAISNDELIYGDNQ
jgi:hypothetical protein